jgi:hypothetical protein
MRKARDRCICGLLWPIRNQTDCIVAKRCVSKNDNEHQIKTISVCWLSINYPGLRNYPGVRFIQVIVS